jgi:hypothetical protein
MGWLHYAFASERAKFVGAMLLLANPLMILMSLQTTEQLAFATMVLHTILSRITFLNQCCSHFR